MPGSVPYASPAVRMFARELGVDLSQVAGSGRGGRIGKEDVQQVVKGALQGGGAVARVGGSGGGLDLLPWPNIDFSKSGEIETREVDRKGVVQGQGVAIRGELAGCPTKQKK